MQTKLIKKDGATYNKSASEKETLVPLFTYQHPGFVLKSCLKAHKLTAKTFATSAEIEISELSQILSGKAPVTESIAHKIAKFFDSNPQNWINMQVEFDKNPKK